jgi:hypothetical protein
LLAAFGCIVFGLCMILNSQVRSDGTWPLYADRLLYGAKLYSDLHAPLQPFFFLEAVAWRRLVGESWLASLIPPVLHLSLFVFGYYTLVNRSALSGVALAAFLSAAFIVATQFFFYSFSDFHVVSDIQYIFSSIVMLSYVEEEPQRIRKLFFPAALGVMAGVSFTTRANEGFLLYLADGAVLFAVAKPRRWGAIAGLTVGFLSTCLFVVLLTGDNLNAYFSNSMIGAAGIKGGSIQLLLDPVSLVVEAILQSVDPTFLIGVAMTAFLVVIPVLVYLSAFNRAFAGRPLVFTAVAVTGLALDVCVIGPSIKANPHFVLRGLVPFFILALFGLALVALLSTIGVIRRASPRASIIFLPAAMLVAESMSSGGHSLGQYGPIGLFIALAPTLYPAAFERKWVCISSISVCVALVTSGAIGKILVPMKWEYYESRTMFVGRKWIMHPIYGPMYVDKSSEVFFESVCRHLGYQAKASLLSVPYSFGPYYCGIAPWHNYVQTWFDTSSQSTIYKLTSELSMHPPMWILYERQLKFLQFHESFYFHGNRIAQRGLDQLIMNRISGGKWKVELEDEPQQGDLWMLIRTTAPGTERHD